MSKDTFPTKEIKKHIEAEGHGFLVLADSETTDEAKVEKIKQIVSIGNHGYDQFKEAMDTFSEKLGVKTKLKIFLVIE